MTAAERVAAGATWLDEVVPGWAGHIDTTRLDSCSSEHDVTGQLVAAGFDAAGDIGSGDSQLGMDIEWDGPYDHPSKEAMRPLYAELTELWRAEIRMRADGGIAVEVSDLSAYHAARGGLAIDLECLAYLADHAAQLIDHAAGRVAG